MIMMPRIRKDLGIVAWRGSWYTQLREIFESNLQTDQHHGNVDLGRFSSAIRTTPCMSGAVRKYERARVKRTSMCGYKQARSAGMEVQDKTAAALDPKQQR